MTPTRDACAAIGAERIGRRVGRDGEATVFAPYPNERMATGEGSVSTPPRLKSRGFWADPSNEELNAQGSAPSPGTPKGP